MRGLEMIITDRCATFLEGGPVAEQHPLEALIARFLARIGLIPHQGPAVTVYIAEALLFCTQFSLPVKGSDIKQAIGYQLDMLVPFPKGSYFYSYETEQRNKETVVTLYTVPEENIAPKLQDLVLGGHSLAGLFPMSQRYLSRGQSKKKWALLLPGSMDILLTFVNGRLDRRLLCPSLPTIEEARELSGCDTVFTPQASEDSGFENADRLPADDFLGKSFNLLPAPYRRPDYFKFLIVGLAILNVLSLFLLLGLKEYRFHSTSNKVDTEIEQLQPAMKKFSALVDKESKSRQEIARLEEISKSPNLLALLANLTSKLPASVYIEQFRVEKKEAAILYLDGYAEDMGDLATSLQTLGEVSLKSTSRRNNKNYFQMEITLP